MIYSSATVAGDVLRDKPLNEPWQVMEHPAGGFYLALYGIPERFYNRN